MIKKFLLTLAIVLPFCFLTGFTFSYKVPDPNAKEQEVIVEETKPQQVQQTQSDNGAALSGGTLFLLVIGIIVAKICLGNDNSNNYNNETYNNNSISNNYSNRNY